MTQILFFKGHDDNPQDAISNAVKQCAPYLMDNPSLIIQLEALSPMGQGWDADVRIMALDTGANDDRARTHNGHGDPALKLEVENPEHPKSGNPNEWRPAGMDHDGAPAAFRFSNAATGGEVPDVPIQDIAIPDYELARASEPELKRMMQELHEKRLKVIEEAKLELE